MAMFKVGIIGCGGRGRGHAQGYKASPDVFASSALPLQLLLSVSRDSTEICQSIRIDSLVLDIQLFGGCLLTL